MCAGKFYNNRLEILVYSCRSIFLFIFSMKFFIICNLIVIVTKYLELFNIIVFTWLYTTANYLVFPFFSFQVQIDNDKLRRAEREVRLSSSQLNLNGLCSIRNGSSTRTIRNSMIDSHGNTLPPLSPQSSNNNSSNGDEEPQKSFPLTPTGKSGWFYPTTCFAFCILV